MKGGLAVSAEVSKFVATVVSFPKMLRNPGIYSAR